MPTSKASEAPKADDLELVQQVYDRATGEYLDPASPGGSELVPFPDIDADVFRENMAGIGLDLSLFPTISVPSAAGVAMWAIPTPDGGKFPLERLAFYVVRAVGQRAYWSTLMGEGDSQPDCSNDDTEKFLGVGNPGGDCRVCPLAAFGSARTRDGKPARGQACKEVETLICLDAHTQSPFILRVPPTSKRNWGEYAFVQSWAGERISSIVTTATLVPAVNKGGTDYYQVRFARQPNLENAGVAGTVHSLQKAFAGQAIEVSHNEVA